MTPRDGRPTATRSRFRRLPAGPLLVIGTLLGLILLVAGTFMAGSYLAGSGDRNRYDSAPSCPAAAVQAGCRAQVRASVESLTPETYVQQSARSSYQRVAAWDMALRLGGDTRSVRLVSYPYGVSPGDTVSAEIWNGAVTQIGEASSVYLTTDSPNAYGNAALVAGVPMAAAGLALAGAAAAALYRRRRRSVDPAL